MNTLSWWTRLYPVRGSTWWPLPLRVIVGYGFMEHGWAKLARGPENFTGILAALHMPFPELLAWATILTELIGRQLADDRCLGGGDLHGASFQRFPFDQTAKCRCAGCAFWTAGLRDRSSIPCWHHRVGARGAWHGIGRWRASPSKGSRGREPINARPDWAAIRRASNDEGVDHEPSLHHESYRRRRPQRHRQERRWRSRPAARNAQGAGRQGWRDQS